MLKTIQQRQLIEQDGAQGKAASVAQALRRYLTVAIEDTFELLVEVLDSHRAQLMQDVSHFDTIAGVRIGTVLRRHQDSPGQSQISWMFGRIVVPIAQDETGFKRQFPQQGGRLHCQPCSPA